jgi:hypothetical protein
VEVYSTAGLALHVGEVLYGNIGGGARRDFTCIDPAVNLAARPERFDFLGQNVRNLGGKIIVTPSKKNVQAFKAKVKAIFAEHKTAKQENLINVLNPGHPGLGELSPSGMCLEDLRLDRFLAVVEDVAVGETEASQQTRRVDQRQILCEHR